MLRNNNDRDGDFIILFYLSKSHNIQKVSFFQSDTFIDTISKLFRVPSVSTYPFIGSPFPVPIRDRVDPSRVRCYGPGLEPRGARAQQPAVFTADASQAGDAPINVSVPDVCGGTRGVHSLRVPFSKRLFA